MPPSIDLISAQDLAVKFGFAAPNEAFRAFCNRLGVRPIRRRPNYYDLVHVRLQLDRAQSISVHEGRAEQLEMSHVEKRRRRLAQIQTA
jgi:hypothetical protein